jgi:hypothetical protein
MNGQRFEVIGGVVSDLQIQQNEEDFLFSSGDKAAGGISAAGLALAGLSGAATGAALNSDTTAERVDFFACKVGDHLVRGKFGQVSFSNGDTVDVAGLQQCSYFDAYAITRPSDRMIWMYPHCGKGTTAYRRFCALWIPAVGFGVLGCLALLFNCFVADESASFEFLILLISANGLICSVIFGFVAARFYRFARLSNRIFIALGFDNPTKVDLHKRLRESGKTFSNVERLNYHPHARWVYKY